VREKWCSGKIDAEWRKRSKLEKIEIVQQHKDSKQDVNNESGEHDGIKYSFAFVHFVRSK